MFSTALLQSHYCINCKIRLWSDTFATFNTLNRRPKLPWRWWRQCQWRWEKPKGGSFPITAAENNVYISECVACFCFLPCLYRADTKTRVVHNKKQARASFQIFTQWRTTKGTDSYSTHLFGWSLSTTGMVQLRGYYYYDYKKVYLFLPDYLLKWLL